jgi:hypothetical protein
VVAVRVSAGPRHSLVPVGEDGYFLVGKPAKDKSAVAVGLDRDGNELPGAALRF